MLYLDIMAFYILSVKKMKEKCLECNGNLIRTDSDMVCINCGLIANQIYEKPSIQLINTEGSYRNQYNSISERPSSMKSLGTFLGTYQKRNLIDVTGSALT